jgi:predicted nucleotidyltransferase
MSKVEEIINNNVYGALGAGDVIEPEDREELARSLTADIQKLIDDSELKHKQELEELAVLSVKGGFMIDREADLTNPDAENIEKQYDVIKKLLSKYGISISK